jgi:hypothetical protein
MKATISDLETLNTLTPMNFINYLKWHGWSEKASNAKGAIWILSQSASGGQGEFEIDLPLETSLRGCLRRVNRLL